MYTNELFPTANTCEAFAAAAAVCWWNFSSWSTMMPIIMCAHDMTEIMFMFGLTYDVMLLW